MNHGSTNVKGGKNVAWGETDDSPAGIKKEEMHQHRTEREVAARKAKERAELQESRSPAHLEATFAKRGLVAGDIFPIFLSNGEMIEAQACLNPLPRGENFVRFVQISRGSEGQIKKMVEESKIQEMMDQAMDSGPAPSP
jgi:hypothetical protein